MVWPLILEMLRIWAKPWTPWVLPIQQVPPAPPKDRMPLSATTHPLSPPLVARRSPAPSAQYRATVLGAQELWAIQQPCRRPTPQGSGYPLKSQGSPGMLSPRHRASPGMAGISTLAPVAVLPSRQLTFTCEHVHQQYRWQWGSRR